MTSVAQAIKEVIIDQHGTPESILTDNGLEFNKKTTKLIQEKCGIEWKYNSPGHHKTVGAVERANQTVFDKTGKICEFGSCAKTGHIGHQSVLQQEHPNVSIYHETW